MENFNQIVYGPTGQQNHLPTLARIKIEFFLFRDRDIEPKIEPEDPDQIYGELLVWAEQCPLHAEAE